MSEIKKNDGESGKAETWKRRQILKTIPAALGSVLIPNSLRALPKTGKTAAPFSRFVDVAHAAGLTETMVYGEIESFTYIVESMGTGCAFFDYDNDGWTDIFIPESDAAWRILRPMPATGSTRTIATEPYRCNRESRVTEAVGRRVSAWEITTTTDLRICFFPTTDRIACIATTATAPSRM